MNPDQFAQVSDGQDRIVEITAGFKEKLMAAGFSPPIAEEGALAFLKMMLRTPHTHTKETD